MVHVVIPSVNYADLLAVTLPAWRACLPDADVRVVTTPRDAETQAVAHASGVRCLVTEAWTHDGAVFAKSRAMNEAFGFAGTEPPPRLEEPCLALDADVYPAGSLVLSGLRARTLYGCPRYLVETPADLAQYRQGRPLSTYHLVGPLGRYRSRTRPAPPSRARQLGKACFGYFQLFLYTGQQFPASPHAGGYDRVFRQQFRQRVCLASCAVLHLGPRPGRSNWRGRRVVSRWEAA